MKNILSLILAVPAVLLVLTLTPGQLFAQRTAAAGILLTVDQTGDSADAAPGDNICADAAGGCTLRAAIEESNARAGYDVINFSLPAGSVVTLTRGELVLTDTVSIVGTGARRLTVERSSAPGTPNFRIFNIKTGAIGFTQLRDLKIRKGIAPAGSNGGGINIETVGNVFLTAVAVSENSADGGGGIANSGILSITRSVINGNTATGAGGGILITANPYDTVISDTTITGNTAAAGGGIDNSGALNLANVTLAQNAATGAASSLRSNAAGNVYTVNTIFSDDSTAPGGSVTGALNSLGNNIITNAAGSTGLTNGVNGDQVSDGNQLALPLGPLADNGGQTDTRALPANSPAIDRGNVCVRTNDCAFPHQQFVQLNSDQRTGYRRLTGNGVDVGAFEYGSTLPNSSVSATFSFLGPRQFNIYNSLAVLTNAVTGEKQYTVVRQFGNYRFRNYLPGTVYIEEIKSKRAGLSRTSVLAFDDTGVFNLKEAKGNYELQMTNDKSAKRPEYVLWAEK